MSPVHPLCPLYPARPLVLRFGAFGDMVLMAPMLRALHARYGAPAELVALGAWTQPLLGRLPQVGAIRLLRSRRGPYLFNPTQWDLVAWLRARPRGPIYVAERRAKTRWFLERAGIEPDWVCSLDDLPPVPREHIADGTLRLARCTPAAAEPPDPPDAHCAPFAPLPLSEAETAECSQWLAGRGLDRAPIVLVQPGNKRTTRALWIRRRLTNVKQWPEAHWVDVIHGVLDQLPWARVVICGTAPERDLAEGIAHRCRDRRVVSAAGELPIPRLLALQARAHSMISVDTGPAHSAAMMGCPVTVLFAKRWAYYYAPRSNGSPVAALEPDIGAGTGLHSITPGRAFDAWAGTLRGEFRSSAA